MRTRYVGARQKARKRMKKQARGFRGGLHGQWTVVQQALKRAEQHAYVGRKLKKRDMRQLWITRLNIASRAHGLPYSRLIAGLHKADIRLDRKQLSELAIHEPAAFAAVVERAKAALAA